MKNTALAVMALLIFSSAGVAQSQRNVKEIASLLENADIFIKYRKFRSEFEQMNIRLGAKLKSYEDYEKLNLAYNNLESQYNEFLGAVRKDLSDWAEIKRMIRTPVSYANRYLDSYKSVTQSYENEYLPVYNQILRNSASGKSKMLSPALIAMGIEVFSAIVDLIQGRKEARDANLSVIIGTINTHFYEKIRMRTWAELDITPPTATRQEAPVPVPDRPTETSDAPGPVVKMKPRMNTTDQTPSVEPALFSDLRGFLEFHYLDAEGQDQKMDFSANKGKNITIETRKLENGEVQTGSVSNRVDYYRSNQSFGEGDQFYLKVNNTAGMYVLTLNSDGTVSILYPFKSKNITVEDRDQNNVTILPKPDTDQKPPRLRYYTFRGSATTETFCVLLSRSPLDVEAARKAIEARSSESFHDRLAAVFGDKLIQPDEAGTRLDGNRLTFDAQTTGRSVLPVVFYIGRQ